MLNCASFLTFFAVATVNFANFDLGHRYEARTKITRNSAALAANIKTQREKDFIKAQKGKCVIIPCCYIYIRIILTALFSCLHSKKSQGNSFSMFLGLPTSVNSFQLRTSWIIKCKDKN